MLKNVLFSIFGVLAFAVQSAKSEEACDVYSVAPGDTLRLISEQYYGARNLSPIIYGANAEIVGENPNTIEIGMVLDIPCRDGMTIPVSYSFIELDQTTQQDTSPYFLARTGSTPFIDTSNLGVIPAVLASALRNGGFPDTLNIIQPTQNMALLEQASAREALLSFPWIKPDCTASASQSWHSIDICEQYTFSNPLYEITLGLFTKKNGALAHASSSQDFKNSRLCMSEFYEGSLPADISQVQSGTVFTQITSTNADCIEGLIQGRFDVIMSDYQTMKTQQGALISDIPAFAHSTTLHAIAHNSNPQAMATLEMVNLGLVRILETGEWFEIVSRNLQLPNR